TLYVPYTQAIAPPVAATVEVRTAGDPLAFASAVRDAVRRIDPGLPLVDMKTQRRQIADSIGRPRAFAWLTAASGAIGLLLAGVGLYGIVSYETARRTNEIGIRMALGARRLDVIRLVMRQTMAIVIAGALAGAALTVASSQLIRAMLFQVAPN